VIDLGNNAADLVLWRSLWTGNISSNHQNFI
jgi:hypothetical protein